MGEQFDMFRTEALPERRPPATRAKRALPAPARQHEALDEAALVSMLEATGRYRILRKLEPRPVIPRDRSRFSRLAVVVDTETTGLDPFQGHRVVEIGCVEMVNRFATGKTFHCYLNPERDMPAEAFAVHGLSADFLKDKPCFAEVVDEFLAFVRDGFVATQHASIRSSFVLLKSGALRRVAAAHFLLFGGYLALLSSLPHLLLDAGVDKLKVGGAIAAWLATAGLANFAGPWISDRIERRRPLILGGATIAGLALAAVAFAPAAQKPVFLAVAAIGGGAFAPLLLTIPFELPDVGAARGGAALGLLMMLGQVGGFLLPVVVGATAEAAGFRAAILGLAMIHSLILVPAFGLVETGRANDHAANAWQKNAGNVA